MADEAANPELSSTIKVVIADGGAQNLAKLNAYADALERIANAQEKANTGAARARSTGGFGGPGGGGGGFGGGGGGYGRGGGRGGRGGPGGSPSPSPDETFSYGGGFLGGFGRGYAENRRNYGPTPWGNAYENQWQNQTSGMPWSPWTPGALPQGGGFFGAAGAGIRGMGNAGGWALRNARMASPVYAGAQAAASSYNAGSVADAAGGTGSDIFRAGMNSNFVTRNALSAYDTFSGRDSKIAIQNMAAERYDVTRQRQQALGRQGEVTGRLDYDMGLQRNVTRSRIAAWENNQRVATFGYIDPSTVGGETRLRETRERQPIASELFELQREREAKQRERTGLGGMLDQTNKERQALLARQAEATGRQIGNADNINVNSANADAERIKAARELDRIDKDLEANDQRRLELAHKMNDVDKELVQNARQLNEIKLKDAEWRERNLNQRAEAAAGQAQGLGGMNPLQRQFAVQAALMVKNTADLDALPDEIIGAAERVIPGEIRKRREGKGKDSEEARTLRREFPDEWRDNLDNVRKAAQVAGNEVIKLRFEIEQQFQKEWDKFVNADAFLNVLKNITGAMFDQMLAAVQNRQQANGIAPK